MSGSETSELARARAAHTERGLHGLLEWPWLYRALQNALGARGVRRIFVDDYVRPGPACRVLDVGCGPADLLDVLPVDVRYTGYDLNPDYVEFARARHGARGRFFAGRAGELDDELLGGPFDRILLIALLHHLDDGPAGVLLAQCRRLLAPGGVLVTFDPVFVDRQPRIARFLISRDRGARVRSPDAYLALLRSEFAATEGVVRGDLLRVPYTHFLARAAATPESLSR